MPERIKTPVMVHAKYTACSYRNAICRLHDMQHCLDRQECDAAHMLNMTVCSSYHPIVHETLDVRRDRAQWELTEVPDLAAPLPREQLARPTLP